MDKKEFQNYLKAGKITKKAQKKARELLVEDCKLLEAVEEIEAFIEKHAKPAFPINLSLNENAAHQTPKHKDKTTLKKKDVLKVDIGVHVSGNICDSAFTINPDNSYEKMIKATEEALEKALQKTKVNVPLGEIGKTIENTAKKHKFKVIHNLSGHGLEKNIAHAPPSIPNIELKDNRFFEDGKAFAIEPFFTTGSGQVVHGSNAEIFELDEEKNTRNIHARKILMHIKENYGRLPFAERWLYRDLKISEFYLKTGLKTLLREKILKAHPVLHDTKNAIVTQAENTILIYKGKTIKLIQ